ncbi:MAG: ABC transporter substrate-binding protein [Anaerolineaceae bacterium]|nr:ABC transporter substrate-binding protein [Anaerolineaceae bacterium]
MTGFQEGMAELGYVEGENIVYDVQVVDFDIPTYQNILQQFVDDKVDLIFVYPTEATLEATHITAGTDVPVVFSFALIEGMGIVNSVQEPGGNVTGVRYPGPDIAVLRYELLRDLMPDLNRILIPYQAGYPIVQSQLAALYPVAEADGVTIVEAPVNTPDELAAFLQNLAESGDTDIDAILGLAEPIAVNPTAVAVMAAFGEEYAIPVSGLLYLADSSYRSLFNVSVEMVKTGGLAAPLAHKIFQGIEPGTIPVVSADPFMEIDYNMIQQLGLELPETVLAVADVIYR